MIKDATEVTRVHMQEKLQWATQCASEIVIREHIDKQAIKHAFWGYLQAYQQIRFYFGKWVEQTLDKNRKQGNILLDKWKAMFLDQQELDAWELLNAFRNEDTHTAPLVASISIKRRMLGANGRFLLFNGRFLQVGTKKSIVLYFQNKEHDLISLCGIGLCTMQKFINTFDQGGTEY